MDIRKHIIILCLLCCHAIGVMADGQIVREYEPISKENAEKLFNFNDPRIKVKAVSYGEFKLVGTDNDKRLTAPIIKNPCFALKVECDEPWSFTFVPAVMWKNVLLPITCVHTLIVDGQAKVLPRPNRQPLLMKRSCELPAGEHEIIIMSKLEVKTMLNIQLRNLHLHAHSMATVEQKPAFCIHDGYIKKKCTSCNHCEVDTLPMQAEKHEFGNEIIWQRSCRTLGVMTRECTICGLSEYKIKRKESTAHNFQNGRCVNVDCNLKLPVKNDAGIYQVGDAYELRGLAEQIAAGDIPRDCNIDLTADIVYPNDLAHIPIGTTEYPFAGTFDGHGHRITGIQLPIAIDMTGLFGVVKGTPRRLAIIANVIIDSNSNMKGTSMTGAICGRADYCDIVRCVNRATIIGTNDVGGIVGYSERECHLIDCAGLGIIDCKGNCGLLSGTMRQGYIMDSYGSGSLTNSEVAPALVYTADSYLRHCFQLDAKAPVTGVTSFSSAQLGDGTLARMLCEKNGKGMPAHWQQGATDAYPIPVFVALTDRPASVIQPQAAEAALYAYSENSYSDEEDWEEEDWEEYYDEGYDEEWHTVSSEPEFIEAPTDEYFIFYDKADSTLYDFTCNVTTTFRNVPAQPMFTAMLGGDATECNVVYCKNDSSVVLEYNYTMDGRRYILTDATKQYMTPDSVVHVEHYEVVGNESDSEFLMTSNTVYYPDNSGYEEKVSHGEATKMTDWEISQDEGTEPTLNYYFYDENGQERVNVYSMPLSDKNYEEEDKGNDTKLPIDMDYTLDENGMVMDLHYVLTDSITGEKYNIGGEYYIYDELGELVQVVSYEPVAPRSHEMRQTEYCTIQTYKHEDDPTSIIPIEHLQPNTLAGAPTRISSHVYDLRGNLVRLNNDPATLKSLPKGIYITRGKKFLVY